jgi:hypothetical protein
MRWCVVLTIASALLLSVSASAATTPNVKVTLVVTTSAPCDMDMPCDPPIGSYVVVFWRAGFVPVKVRMTGPGTSRTYLRPGQYSATVKSLRSGVVRRAGTVRIRASGVSAIRLMAPA